MYIFARFKGYEHDINTRKKLFNINKFLLISENNFKRNIFHEENIMWKTWIWRRLFCYLWCQKTFFHLISKSMSHSIWSEMAYFPTWWLLVILNDFGNQRHIVFVGTRYQVIIHEKYQSLGFEPRSPPSLSLSLTHTRIHFGWKCKNVNLYSEPTT